MKALALLLVAAPVLADQALPVTRAAPRPSWVERCRARLERARVEGRRRIAGLDTAVVSISPGVVELTNSALVAVMVGESAAVARDGRWSDGTATPRWRPRDDGWTDLASEPKPYFGPGAHDPQVLAARRRGNRVGIIAGDGLPRRDVARFEATFRRIVDACLEMP